VGEAMTVNSQVMQQLHRINRQKTDLKGQLDRGPKTVLSAHRKLQAAEANVEQTHQKHKQMRMDADRKQLLLKEREAKIHDLERKLNAAKENREYQTLKDQIAAEHQANIVLSDETLELLDQIDQVAQSLKAATAFVAEVKLEVAAIEKQVAERKIVLESELKRVETELATVEGQLEGDFKRDYIRLVAARGDDAMAELEGKSCGGCYQTLTTQMLERLYIGTPAACPACGRLLYDKSGR
jgi:uncharacterized protein